MDAQRFDNLTRFLARGASRRGLLKGLAGGLLGVVGAGGVAGASAQRRGQAVGLSCNRAAECASFLCVDGVCCDTACAGQCESCISGACTPVSGPPIGGRPPCSGMGPCQAVCDGDTISHCAGWPGAETGCGEAACAGGWLTTFACGGNGSCVPTTTSCGLYACGGSGCLTSCAGDGDCLGAAYCVGGNCQAAPPVELPCERSDQCLSGSCVDGVCQPLDPCAGIDCDDSDPCTVDQCRDGTCSHTLVAGCCTADAECPTPDDPCRAGSCVGGECRIVPANDGGSCDDGNACTRTDVCQAGACVGGDPVVCQALDQCHEAGSCDPATGRCSDPPAKDATPCDDGNACTRRDSCQGGVCVGSAPVSCPNPPGPCFLPAACDPATGACLEPVLEAGYCFIGGVCWTSDQPHKDDPCLRCDATLSATAWSAVADGMPCSDDNACTDTDTCQKGVCTPGTSVVCQPLDDCHDAGVCDPETGTCSDPLKANGALCDDGDPCTIEDACVAGVCHGAPRDCSESDGPCAVGRCHPLSGGCEPAPLDDDSLCDDGDPCTEAGVCQDGTCMPGPRRDCSASDGVCVVGVCNSGTGDCEQVRAENGAPCVYPFSGGCTENDFCVNGACFAGAPVVCTPSDICHAAECQPGTGCVETVKSDGSTCGEGQICVAGVCETCRVGGKECTAHAQCCSGDCLGGFCACKPFGGMCDGDADCCIGVCADGSCSCRGADDTCAAGSECCSGTCGSFPTPNVCACSGSLFFSRCLTSSDCCSGICEDGSCSCRLDGEACSSDDNCCTGPCVDGECGCKDLFEGCDSGSDCCTGICSIPFGEDTGFCSCLFLGQTCDADHKCCGILPGCCNDACVEMDSNLDHCGSCGNDCATGDICSSGHCCPFGEEWRLTRCCPPFTNEIDGVCCLYGLDVCNGSCVSLEFDPNNCGACGRGTPSGGVCLGGVPQCLPGFFESSGLCCLIGLHNDNGICCSSGWSNCDGRCVDRDIDPLNCGSCNFTCESFPFVCAGGECFEF